MDLSLYITKLGVKDESPLNAISINDWRTLVESDPSLIWFENTGLPGKEFIPPKILARWFDPIDPKNYLAFDFYKGKFSFINGNYNTEYVDEPFDRGLFKMLEVSRKLNATLQTYSGFDIDERFINGEVTLPEDDDEEE